jgi:hypothetical protein
MLKNKSSFGERCRRLLAKARNRATRKFILSGVNFNLVRILTCYCFFIPENELNEQEGQVAAVVDTVQEYEDNNETSTSAVASDQIRSVLAQAPERLKRKVNSIFDAPSKKQ